MQSFKETVGHILVMQLTGHRYGGRKLGQPGVVMGIFHRLISRKAHQSADDISLAHKVGAGVRQLS